MMRSQYVVRPLSRKDFGAALGMRFAIYEIMSDGAQTVALCYEEAHAKRLCKAMQQFGDTGTKPLGGPMRTVLSDTQPQPI
jgi:hypothetical protein